MGRADFHRHRAVLEAWPDSLSTRRHGRSDGGFSHRRFARTALAELLRASLCRERSAYVARRGITPRRDTRWRDSRHLVLRNAFHRTARRDSQDESLPRRRPCGSFAHRGPRRRHGLWNVDRCRELAGIDAADHLIVVCDCGGLRRGSAGAQVEAAPWHPRRPDPRLRHFSKDRLSGDVSRGTGQLEEARGMSIRCICVSIVALGTLGSRNLYAEGVVWVEAESAFESGRVRGVDRALHMMVASGGHCVAGGWGRRREDRIHVSVRLREAIDQAAIAVRYSARLEKKSRPLFLKIRLEDSARGGEMWTGRIALSSSRILEEFNVEVARLPSAGRGRYKLHASLSRPLSAAEEVWLDAFALFPRGHPPVELTRKLHYSNVASSGTSRGHFDLVFSPNVTASTLSQTKKLFKKVESHYRVIAEYFGNEPPGKRLTCCVSAKADSAKGAAHANGQVFFVDEENVFEPESGNIAHEMTHCFQENFASNGHIPAWLREGEAYFACCVVDATLYKKSVAEVAWPPFRDRSLDAIRRMGLDEFGLCASQYYRTELHPRDNRPHYLIWNRLFYELFRLDQRALRTFHDRVRKSIAAKTYPLDATMLRDVHLVNATYVDFLCGENSKLLELFEHWGFTTWPCETRLPAVGELVLDVACGAALKSEDVARRWNPKTDRRATVRARNARLFSYTVKNGRSWKSGPHHQWFFQDQRGGPAPPLKLELRVPKDFEGSVVLDPDIDGRDHEIVVEGSRRIRTTYEREVVLPVTRDDTRDGRVDIEVFRRRGINGAVRRLRVYKAPELGKQVLRVECAKRAAIGPNLTWSAKRDERHTTEGIRYRVTRGKCWTDGESHQWFHHDRRFGNTPLSFELKVPKTFRGHLLITGDLGERVQRYTIDDQRSYVGRGSARLDIPITAADTQDGRVRVDVRRLSGNNCALRAIELRAAP